MNHPIAWLALDYFSNESLNLRLTVPLGSRQLLIPTRPMS